MHCKVDPLNGEQPKKPRVPFISIEGVDGSGKTKQTEILVEHLRSIGRSVVRTKEPDGGRLGAEVRAILVNPCHVLSPVEQLLLVSAARYDHVRNVVRPAIEKGSWVVSDRFLDSTFAFQVAVSESDLSRLHEVVAAVVVGATMPDLTVILDCPIEVASARRKARVGGENDPAEAFRDFKVIRKALLEAARRDPRRCRVVEADREAEVVAADIRRLIEPFL